RGDLAVAEVPRHGREDDAAEQLHRAQPGHGRRRCGHRPPALQEIGNEVHGDRHGGEVADDEGAAQHPEDGRAEGLIGPHAGGGWVLRRGGGGVGVGWWSVRAWGREGGRRRTKAWSGIVVTATIPASETRAARQP